MKKLLSLTLIIAMLITLIVPMTTVSAKSTTKKTTYLATQDAYKNSNGIAYMKDNELHFKGNDGKDKVLLSFGYSSEVSFYMRGKTIYYSVYDHEYEDENITPGIYSININGKKNTLIKSRSFSVLGGYGSTILTITGSRYIGYRVYSIADNGTKILFNTSTGNVVLFNGRIYYGNKAYIIDTGKTITFKNKGKVSSNSYMYYINSKNSLIRLDKAGKKTTIAKNAKEVLYANDGKTVIYRKGNTYYRKTGTGKAYALTTKNKLQNELMYPQETYAHAERVEIKDVAIINKVVYFNAEYDFGAIVSVNDKGGKLNRITGIYFDDPFIDSMTGIGKKIYYTLVGTDDIVSFDHKVLNVAG
ncbi:MAG: hypothetical protein J1F17_03795 [Oscillospiraceae bacterium]|nr:hypothetical protein [Oscillospiraceae bacterium]